MSAKSFFLFLGGMLLSTYLFFSNGHDAWSTFTNRRHKEPIVNNDTESGIVNSIAYDDKEKFLYTVLDEKYYDQDKIDLPQMQENALKGFVEAIGDPHTEYLTKEENEVFDESMAGSQHFEGIGAVVSKKQDGIMITEIIKGSPAFVAGLQPLDIIISIDGESTEMMSVSDAVKKIRGPKDSTVTLSIFRQREEIDEPEVLEKVVTRGTIDVPSVNVRLVPTGDSSILVAEVGIFGEDTITTLQKALLQLSGNYQGVVLDLRGNGGGYLPTAVELASFFLPKNEIVTTAKYTTLPDEIFRSDGVGTFLGKPTAVLIDGMSASASEIVAGALQQRGHAKLVGTKSFGKGSIQTIQEIKDGSMLKYTIGKWYLPNDVTIDHVGLIPDVEVKFDADAYASGKYDNQLQKALELFANPTNRGTGGCCS